MHNLHRIAAAPRSSAVLLLAITWGAPAVAQKLHLVEDVATDAVNLVLHERQVVTWNGWRYFARDGVGVGAELHRSHVATGALELVLDLMPGPDGSRPDLFTLYGGSLYFVADDGVHGVELWRTDGTALGTQIVADLDPGKESAFALAPWSRAPLAIAGGEMFFAASDGASDTTLWHSDGSAAGMLKVPGAGSNPTQIISDGAAIYYQASFSALRRATAAGATVLKTFYAGPNGLTAFNGAVYFHAALSQTDSYELWKSDGTPAGTVLVKDIFAGAGLAQSSYPSLFTVAGGKLYFSANDGVHGRELWTSDGTPGGTSLVADIGPGPANGLADNIFWSMTSFGGLLYFAADGGGGATLWRSDGTPAGTQPVVPGAGAPQLALLGSLPEGEVAGPALYFAGGDAVNGVELWSTDGTAAGTALVADLEPGGGSSWPRSIEHDSAGGAAGLAGPVTDAVLWTSAGSAVTTAIAADHAVASGPPTGNASPMGVFDLFGRVLVGAWTGATGHELWSGSAAAGLDLVVDANPGSYSAFLSGDVEGQMLLPFHGLRLGAQVLFLSEVGTQIALWATDGTPAGTQMLSAFGSWSGIDTTMTGVALDDEIVFRMRGHGSTSGVWRSDGTAAGTSEILSVGSQTFPSRFVRLGNRAIFTVDGTSDSVWVTDGTAQGTILLLSSSSSWLGGNWIAAVGEHAYFPAGTASTGIELWRTDGTSPGTELVLDIRPGAVGSDPQRLTRLGDELVFSADDGVAGRELWRSDGTPAGTALIDVVGGPQSSTPTELTVSGDRLFFATGTSASGLRVYSQGVVTTLPGFGGGSPGVSSMRAVGSRRVFFRGNLSPYGRELWSSDGTYAGTELFDDFLFGTLGSDPSESVLSDGLLYVAASDSATGSELRYAHVGATAQPIGQGCAASGHLPALSADDPLLGATTVVRLRDADAGSFGALFVGAQSAPWFLGGGCDVYPDPLSALPLALLSTGPGGAWTSAPFALPPDPGLVGAQVVLQAIVGPSTTAPLGFDLSNGVLLTLHAY